MSIRVHDTQADTQTPDTTLEIPAKEGFALLPRLPKFRPPSRTVSLIGLFLAMAAAGGIVWGWQVWLPQKLPVYLKRIQLQLEKDYQITTQFVSSAVGFTPKGELDVSMLQIEAQHPIGRWDIPALHVYIPLLPLLQFKPVKVSGLVLVSPHFQMKTGWQSYKWPQLPESKDKPLVDAELKVVNGYQVEFPLPEGKSFTVSGPGIDWQHLDSEKSRMEMQGVLTSPGADITYQLETRWDHWVIQGAGVRFKPRLRPDTFPKPVQAQLQNLRLQQAELPELLADWNPTQWRLQTTPESRPVRLNIQGIPLDINQLQVVGKSTAHGLTLEAGKLVSTLQPSALTTTQPQTVTLLAQGKADWLNGLTLDGITQITPFILKGRHPDAGLWQLSGGVQSHWKGAPESIEGVHKIELKQLITRYGQQHGQLVAVNRGPRLLAGLIQRLDGTLYNAPLHIEGEFTPTRFNGLATVKGLTLSPQRLQPFSQQIPVAYRPKSGQVDLTLKQVNWQTPQTGLVAKATLKQLVLPDLPVIHFAEIAANRGQIALTRALIPVGGKPLTGQALIDLNRQTILAQAKASDIDIRQVRRQLPDLMKDIPASISGHADLTAQASGPLNNPKINADVQLRHLNGSMEGVALQNGYGDIRLRGNQWLVNVSRGDLLLNGNTRVALKGQLGGSGNTVNQTRLQTEGTRLSALGIPVDNGQVRLQVNKKGNLWDVNALLEGAAAQINGHTLAVDGLINARIPHQQLVKKQFNHVWLQSSDTLVRFDGLPTQLTFSGYPLLQQGMTVNSLTPMDKLWAHPPLKGIISQSPPYETFASQWQLSQTKMQLKQASLQHPTDPGWQPLLSLNPYIGFTYYPKKPDQWTDAYLRFPDKFNLAALETFLNPTDFKDIEGQVSGSVAIKAGLLNLADGQLQVKGLQLPALQVNPLDALLVLKGEEGHLDLNKLTVPGITEVSLQAHMAHWDDWPMRFTNPSLSGKQFNIARFQKYINEVVIGEISDKIVTPAIGPWERGRLVLPFELNDAATRFDEVIYQNILLEQVTGRLHILASSYMTFKDVHLKAAQGEVFGSLSLDPIENNFLTLDLHASGVSANPLAIALLNVPNQIFGTMTGDIRFTTSGKTEEETLKNTNGTATLSIEDGRVPAIAKVETLLTGANVIRTGVLGLSLNNLSRLVFPFDINEFSKLSGNLVFTNGKAYTTEPNFLTSQNKNLTLRADGNIDLITAESDLLVYGRMRQNVQGTFGKLGQWSLLYLLGHIPGINLGKGRNLLAYIPGVGFVPGFGMPPKGQRNHFTVRMKGEFGDPKAVKDLTWGKIDPVSQARWKARQKQEVQNSQNKRRQQPSTIKTTSRKRPVGPSGN